MINRNPDKKDLFGNYMFFLNKEEAEEKLSELRGKKLVLKTPDEKTHQIIVARNGIWVDALEAYKKEELKNQN